jgi:hypothetical protein
MSFTTDPNDNRLKRGVDQAPTPQSEVYLVLSDEEKAKGFIRPVRTSYVHVGKELPYKRLWYVLNKENPQHQQHILEGFVAVMVIIEDKEGDPTGGTYVREHELEAFYKGIKRTGGCGTETSMPLPIAETYARDPKFYGSTYCVHCQMHLPVNQFFWKGTAEEVGS